MKRLIFSGLRVCGLPLALLSLIACTSFVAHGYDGGGGAISSYHRSEWPIGPLTPQQWADLKALVTKRKEEANLLKPALGFGEDGKGFCWWARFAYIKEETAEIEPLFALTGTLPDGKKKTLELSVLNGLTIVKQDTATKRVLCDLDVFPAITPAQLIKTQPSYTLLSQKFRKTVRLWVKLTGPKGGVLTLVGSKERQGVQDDVRLPFARLPLNRRIEFNLLEPDRGPNGFLRGAYWWAIPSVIEDRAYPIRIHTAN